jgi:hypothetical protein
MRSFINRLLDTDRPSRLSRGERGLGCRVASAAVAGCLVNARYRTLQCALSRPVSADDGSSPGFPTVLADGNSICVRLTCARWLMSTPAALLQLPSVRAICKAHRSEQPSLEPPPFPRWLAFPARNHPENMAARVCQDGNVLQPLCPVTSRHPGSDSAGHACLKGLMPLRPSCTARRRWPGPGRGP